MIVIFEITNNNRLKLIKNIDDTMNFDQASRAFNFQKDWNI